MKVHEWTIYLNLLEADQFRDVRGRPPTEYELVCRFMRCGVIDRATSQSAGLIRSYVLDPIPAPAVDGVSFAELCDRVGHEIVLSAIQTNREIAVLWSGGIDSTAALIAIIKAADEANCRDLVRILLSIDSVREYPRFFLQHINGRFRLTAVQPPISEHLDPARINVTGEHGDQLFGSHLLEPYARIGLAGEHFRDMLPIMIRRRIQQPRNAGKLMEYFNPVIKACPVPIRTLFDCLWWLNFALKWQDVTLRLPVLRGNETKAVYDSLWHFFRDRRFQAWSLANVEYRTPPTWAQYKEIAKRYIYAYTGDEDYYRSKEKVDSLRNVISRPIDDAEYRIRMGTSFQPQYTLIEEPEAWRLRAWMASTFGRRHNTQNPP